MSNKTRKWRDKMTKRNIIIAILGIFLLLRLFGGCGKKDKFEEEARTPPPEEAQAGSLGEAGILRDSGQEAPGIPPRIGGNIQKRAPAVAQTPPLQSPADEGAGKERRSQDSKEAEEDARKGDGSKDDSLHG